MKYRLSSMLMALITSSFCVPQFSGSAPVLGEQLKQVVGVSVGLLLCDAALT